MSYEYTIVTRDIWGDIQLYNFNEKELYKFLNEVQKLEGLTNDERDDSDSSYNHIETPVQILKEFPTATDNSNERQSDGSYCVANVWPKGGVFILKRDKVFIPKIVTHTNTVTVTEFAPAPNPRKWTLPSKKAASKKATTK